MRVDRPDRDPPRDRALPERPGLAAGLPRPDRRRLPRQHRISRGRAAACSHHLIGVALSMLLIGLFLMVTRKKAITQILALLTVENAVFLVAVGVDLRHAARRRARDFVRRDPRRPGARHPRPSHRRPVRVDGRQPALEVERIAVNLLVWTLVVPLRDRRASAAWAAPRPVQGGRPGRRPRGDVRAVPGDGRASSLAATSRPRSATRCASTGCRRWCSCSAASSVCCRAPTASGTCGATKRAGWSRRGCAASSTA